MKFSRFIKSGIIGVVALVITTIGISASDTLQGVSGSLLGQLAAPDASGCPAGMIATPMLQTVRCVDAYEASPAPDCAESVTRSALDTEANIARTDCAAHSESGSQPWVFATREQARLLCMRAGKRLPTAAEWYQLAIGTPEDSCVIASAQAAAGGSQPACTSALGVSDMVGNVWEWTSDDVVDGVLGTQTLPTEGYVSQVAENGIVVYTETQPVAEFGEDFFWTKTDGVYGVLRGGFYGSGSDAGVYATQAKTAPTMATQAIGFRCVL